MAIAAIAAAAAAMFRRKPEPPVFKHEGLPDLLTALRRVTSRYGTSATITAEEMCDLCAAFDHDTELKLQDLLTPVIPLLSMVALNHSHECDEGVLPEGATGTVVLVYRDHPDYEVEFNEPFHCVITLMREDIRAI